MILKLELQLTLQFIEINVIIFFFRYTSLVLTITSYIITDKRNELIESTNSCKRKLI